MSRSPVLRGESAAGVTVVYPETVVVDAAELLSIKDQARAEGYRAGLEAAAVDAERAAQQYRDDVRSALSALTDAIAQASTALGNEQRRLEVAACDLSFGIAEAILAREISVTRNPGREAIVRALGEVAIDGPTTIRLHPADVAALGDADILPVGTNIVPDASIGRGGCVLKVGAAMIDTRIETALQRVRQVLDTAVATQ